MNIRSINFKQPKYIFPLIMSVPLTGLIYFVSNMFTSEKDETPTDRINMSLPDPNLREEYNKLRNMEDRYSVSDDAFSAVDGFGKETEGKESLDADDEYSDSEVQKILEESQRRRQEQKQIEELQYTLNNASRRMGDSPSRSNDYSYPSSYSSSYSSQPDGPSAIRERYLNELEAIKNGKARSMKDIYETDETETVETPGTKANVAELQKEKAPIEVFKASSLSPNKFKTVGYNADQSDSPLIKAMIDATTKSTDGTRLRFKLLDDVVIDDVKLLKGTYLYGTVTGFGSQRVKANITSVLVGSRFLNVNLSVYDVDGMEGFYVPASSFREFVQNATASIAGQQIQISDNSGGQGVNPQLLALQALQNVYQAGSSAIGANIKKNKAKIKYNTIVYLINTQQ